MEQRQARDDHRAFYERVGEEKNLWEAPRNSNLYFQEMRRYDEIMRQIPSDARTAVDLACGDGYLSYLMAERGLQVTAVDLADARLDKFEERAAQLGISQVKADIAATGLADWQFDLALASEILEHLQDYQSALAEAHRLLRPGGHFICSVPYKEKLRLVTCPHCLKQFHPNGHMNVFDRDNLPEALEQAGFTVRTVKTNRSRLTNLLQYHLRLPYGRPLRAVDTLLTALNPEFTFYLIIKAQKPHV